MAQAKASRSELRRAAVRQSERNRFHRGDADRARERLDGLDRLRIGTQLHLLEVSSRLPGPTERNPPHNVSQTDAPSNTNTVLINYVFDMNRSG